MDRDSSDARAGCQPSSKVAYQQPGGEVGRRPGRIARGVSTREHLIVLESARKVIGRPCSPAGATRGRWPPGAGLSAERAPLT